MSEGEHEPWGTAGIRMGGIRLYYRGGAWVGGCQLWFTSGWMVSERGDSSTISHLITPYLVGVRTELSLVKKQQPHIPPAKKWGCVAFCKVHEDLTSISHFTMASE